MLSGKEEQSLFQAERRSGQPWLCSVRLPAPRCWFGPAAPGLLLQQGAGHGWWQSLLLSALGRLCVSFCRFVPPWVSRTLRLQSRCILAMPSTSWRLCRATCPGMPSREGPSDIAWPMDLCSVHLYYRACGSGMERELITLIRALRCFLKILSTLLMEPRLPNSLNLLFFLNRLFRHNRFSVIKLIKMEE